MPLWRKWNWSGCSVQAGEDIARTALWPGWPQRPASIRRAALQRGIPYCTTLAAARASASAIRALNLESIGVRALQEIHAGLAAGE